jgi:hypothetical protein
MNNTPDSPAKPPDDRMDQGGNYWTLFTPGIWKVLHAVLQRKDIGVVEIGFASALTAREFCESEAYRATIEDQRRHLRSVGAFLVTGVYTYVRDGVITTAGLRGSRTAELIERIGAVNQTRDEVTRRFVQDPTSVTSP